jgi:hypothetical protein
MDKANWGMDARKCIQCWEIIKKFHMGSEKLFSHMIGLVFVHGFMGSQQSFRNFPLVLKKLLEDQGFELEVLYYEYDTKGNNQRQTQRLMDFLISKCHTVQYSKVILLGHSMGGILAADSYRFLYQIEGTTDSTNASTLQRIKSWFSYSKPQLATEEEMRMLLNIVGVITFDSPFYGLHPHLINASINKLPEIVPDLEIPIPKPKDLIPDHINVPIAKGLDIPVPTKWVKEKFHGNDIPVSVDASTKATNHEKELNPEEIIQKLSLNETSLIPRNDKISTEIPSASQSSLPEPSGWNWTTGALALGALTTIASTSLATPLATAHAVKQMDTLSRYASFLDPLTHTFGQAHQRIELLSQQQKKYNIVSENIERSSGLSRTFFFKAFYNSIGSQTFCIPPPDVVQDHFHPLSIDAKDVLDAHMNMFDPQMIGDQVYQELVQECIQLLKTLQ